MQKILIATLIIGALSATAFCNDVIVNNASILNVVIHSSNNSNPAGQKWVEIVSTSASGFFTGITNVNSVCFNANTDKETYAMLLKAMSSGDKIKITFYDNTSGIPWAGTRLITDIMINP